jgi:hypothetical protein
MPLEPDWRVRVEALIASDKVLRLLKKSERVMVCFFTSAEKEYI